MAGNSKRILSWGMVVWVALLLAIAAGAGVSSADESLEQQCITAGLRKPKVEHAYMLHPGRRPYEKSPTNPGPVQTIDLVAHYLAMPQTCTVEYHRKGSIMLLKKVNGHLRNLVGPGQASGGYLSDMAGDGQANRTEGGHDEPGWYYWHPGDRYIAVLFNQLINNHTHEIVASSRKHPQTVRIRIRGGGSSRHS